MIGGSSTPRLQQAVQGCPIARAPAPALPYGSYQEAWNESVDLCEFMLLALFCAGLPIREGPGAGFVLWAETVGTAPVDRVYANSAGLPGDAVVTFMRALCAVSQEELVPGRPGV